MKDFLLRASGRLIISIGSFCLFLILSTSAGATGYGNDAGVSAITSPGSPLCAGNAGVKVTVVNDGIDTLTSATISWSINGVAQTDFNFKDTIVPSSSMSVSIGSFNFFSGLDTIKVWTSNPNGVLDSNASNDTSLIIITVNPLPNDSIIGYAKNSSNLACESATLSFDDVGIPDASDSTYGEIYVYDGSTVVWHDSQGNHGSLMSSGQDFWFNNSLSSSGHWTKAEYTLIVTNSSGCSDTNKIVVNVSIPAAAAGSSKSICAGISTNIGASAVNGSTYTWTSNPSGFSSTEANPTVTPSGTTSYTVTETNSTGCSASNSVTITVIPLPATPSAGNNATVCAGSSIQIGSAAVSGLTYAWSSNPSGLSSGSSSLYVAPKTTTSYTLVATSTATSCTSLPGTVTITVNPLPAAAAGSSTAVCASNSATIGATAVSGDNYSWTSTPSGYTSTASTASVTPTATTVYYVTETNPVTGCSNTNSVLITVNPLPAAYAGSSASLCSGSPTTTIGGTSVSGHTYSWSPTTYLSSGSVSNPSVTLGATTTYTLTETITATGCSNSNNITLTLNPSPSANTGVSQAICAGSSAKLGIASVSGNTYSWSPSKGLSSPTISNPTASPASTTSYALTETVSATGCKTTNYVTVSVNPLPAAYVGSVSATSVCTGSSFALGGTPVSGDLYSWTSNPSGFTSSLANPSATPTVQTTYTLVETNATTGCSNSNNIAIGLITLPVANISTAAICAGSNGVVVANNTLSSEKFKWYYNGAVLSGQTGFRLITANGGAYQVNINDTATGCSNMSNVATLVVNPLPSAIVKTLQATTQCDGDSVTMVAPLVSDYMYQWSRNGSVINGATDYMYSAKQSGVYQLMVTSTTTKCSDTSASINVTINPVPIVPFNVPGKTTVCQGFGVLMNTSQQTGVTYTWMKNGVAIANSDSNYYSATSTGTYNAMLTFNATGCSNTTSSVNVTVNALPQTNVSALGNKNLCPGASVLLVADPSPNYTYRWENSTGYIAGATSDTFTASQADNYQVTVTNQFACSATSSPISVTAAQHPSVTINRPSVTTFCQKTITLSVKDTDAASIQWWKDGSPISGATHDSLDVNTTGFYAAMVKGTVTCTAMDTIGITVNSIPNVMFSVSNDTICYGKAINFANQSSISPAENLSYTWTFGDGDSSFDMNTSHKYTSAGRRNVMLNVAAASGCNATVSDSVLVLPVTSSLFSVSPQGDRRLGFKAIDTTGATYVWNYGDSTFGTGINGYHKYSRDGKFNITLTVINANGCVTSTTSSQLVILSGFGQMSDNNIKINVFPNPFKTQTNVQYDLNQNSMVQVDIFDITGRVISHIDNSMQTAGQHNFVFNGPNPGIYFVKMVVGGQLFVNRIVQQ